MGLLDDLLGQLAGGPAMSNRPAPGARADTGGPNMAAILMALMPVVLAMLGNRRGGNEPAAGFGSARGGLGDILGQVLGGGSASQTQDSAADDDVLPQRTQAPSSTQSSGQPNLDSILKDVLGGAASSTSSRQQQAPQSGGGIIDILGSILGGGRR